MRLTAILVAGAGLALAACSPLTAEAPLFSPADQDAALVIAQGLWVGRDADCKVNPAHSRPERKSCLDWARITREADGRWLLTFVPDDEDGPMRVVLAPASARGSRTIAPLYIAEGVNTKTGAIAYAGFVARGERDVDGAVRRFAIAPVTCDIVESAGGVTGVAMVREDDRIVRCVAASQEAAKEATRLAAIDALPILGENELVFVRP
jgi:hypothetical protein